MSSIPSPSLRISFPKKTAEAPIIPPLRKSSVSTGVVLLSKLSSVETLGARGLFSKRELSNSSLELSIPLKISGSRGSKTVSFSTKDFWKEFSGSLSSESSGLPSEIRFTKSAFIVNLSKTSDNGIGFSSGTST